MTSEAPKKTSRRYFVEQLSDPIPSHTRMDGRQVHAVNKLDFRPTHDELDAILGDRRLLNPGVIVGAVVRYRWPGINEFPAHRRSGLNQLSRRIHVLFEYHGENTVVDTPCTWRSRTATQTAEVPVMEAKIWKDAWQKIGTGTIAVARLQEERPAMLYNLDHEAIQSALNITPKGDHMAAHVGYVQLGGLYYIPPLNQ